MANNWKRCDECDRIIKSKKSKLWREKHKKEQDTLKK